MTMNIGKFRVIALLGICGAGFMQTTPQTKLEMQEEIVVTAQFMPESSKESIYDVKVISQEEIQALGATQLGELLTKEFHMDIEQKSVFGASLGMQGVSHENVKIMLDGVPIVGRLNGIIDLNHVSLANIERVEMIQGPVSVYYGTESLAGVVNLISKKALADRSTVDLEGYYESIGEWVGHTRLGYAQGAHAISLSGGTKVFDGHTSYDGQRHQEWNERDQHWIDLHYSVSIGELALAYGGGYFDEHLDDRGEPSNGVAKDIDYHTNRTNHQASLKGFIGEHYFLDSMISFSDYDRTKSTDLVDLNTGDVTASTRSSDSDETTYDQWLMRSMIASNSDAHFHYQVGVEFSREETSGRRIQETTQSVEDYAIFTSAKIQLGSRTVVQPALRYSYNSEYDAPLAPSLHLLFSPAENHHVRASYGRGFRAPSLKELFLDFTMPAGPFIYNITGNIDLKAERGHNFNSAYRGDFELAASQFSIDSNIFYNRIENMITLSDTVPDSQQPNILRRHYINVERHASYGAHVTGTWRNEVWSLMAGLSRTALRNELSDDHEIPSFAHTTDGKAEIGFRPIPRLDTRLIYKYHGERPGYFLFEDRATRTSEVRQTTIDAFNDMDFSIGTSFKDDLIRITAGVKNIFDVENLNSVDQSSGTAHAVNQISWGRTYFLKMGLSLDVARR